MPEQSDGSRPFAATAGVWLIEAAELEANEWAIPAVVVRRLDGSQQEETPVAQRLDVNLQESPSKRAQFPRAHLVDVDLLEAGQRTQTERHPAERKTRAGAKEFPGPGHVRRIRKREVGVECQTLERSAAVRAIDEDAKPSADQAQIDSHAREGTSTDAVLTAAIAADGTLGDFTASSVKLSYPVGLAGEAVIGKTVYLFEGFKGGTGATTSIQAVTFP